MMLNAKFIGQLDFSIGEKSITTSLSEKACGVLCYLMMNSSKFHYREHVAGMFWEKSDKNSASSNLRYILWSIRKNLDSTGKKSQYILSPNKSTIKFSGEHICGLDVFQFKDFIKKANILKNSETDRIILLKKAAELYRGGFLEGFYIQDAPTFNDWVFYEREDLQRLYFQVQFKLSEEYVNLKQYNQAILPLKKLIKIDPLHEELYYRLIKLYALSGHRIAAMEVYQQLKKTLREELNISPMKETQTLFKLISAERELKTPVTLPTMTTKNTYNQLIPYEKTGIHMKFLMVSSKSKLGESQKKLKEVTLNHKEVTIEIGKLPGKRILYEGIYEIIEEYIKLLENQDDSSYLKETLIELDNFKEINSSNEYFLFQQLCSMLQRIGLDRIIINIHNLHFYDEKIFDFLSFLSRKCQNSNITVLGVFDTSWDHPRFQLFEKAFQQEENFEFIYL